MQVSISRDSRWDPERDHSQASSITREKANSYLVLRVDSSSDSLPVMTLKGCVTALMHRTIKGRLQINGILSAFRAPLDWVSKDRYGHKFADTAVSFIFF